jgi:hypothetical protein
VERSPLHFPLLTTTVPKVLLGARMREGVGLLESCYGQKTIHQHLARDHHPKISYVAVRTVAVIEHTLLDLLSDTEPTAVEVFTVSDPAKKRGDRPTQKCYVPLFSFVSSSRSDLTCVRREDTDDSWSCKAWSSSPISFLSTSARDSFF